MFPSPPDDFRMFCGDLGNEVTDETLVRAFNKYPSFLKAKVVRDRRTNKTKGYGFVSFKDPVDFTRAMREMNGESNCRCIVCLSYCLFNLYCHTLFTPLYATRGSFGPGNI